jgi:hypothetical protein
VVGNKGGLVCKLDVYRDSDEHGPKGLPISLCFISCHLAAHWHHWMERNANVAEILCARGARVGEKWLDPTVQFDHCFFMGDLNYRVDLLNKEEDLKEPPKKVAAVWLLVSVAGR